MLSNVFHVIWKWAFTTKMMTNENIHSALFGSIYRASVLVRPHHVPNRLRMAFFGKTIANDAVYFSHSKTNNRARCTWNGWNDPSNHWNSIEKVRLSLFLFSHDLHFIFLFLVFLFTLKSFGNDTIVKNSSNACFDFKCVHYDFVDILENHRISRTILSAVQTVEEDFESQLNNSRSSTLNDTQTERDMNDILGPLPEIPTSNADYCNRLSTRRSSGGSGIYEEILDPVESSM